MSRFVIIYSAPQHERPAGHTVAILCSALHTRQCGGYEECRRQPCCSTHVGRQALDPAILLRHLGLSTCRRSAARFSSMYLKSFADAATKLDKARPLLNVVRLARPNPAA